MLIFEIIVFSPQFVQAYDEWCDTDYPNPNFTGYGSPKYMGGSLSFRVDKDFPKTMVITNFNTSIHNLNVTFYPENDDYPKHSVSFMHYWRIEKRFGPDIYEPVNTWMWYFVADYNFTTYWPYELDFVGWRLICSGRWLGEYYDPLGNITISNDWRGWI